MEIKVKKIIFKKYTGTKTVCAAPMTKADAEKLLGISISPATPGNDGYLVEYPDGYRSWSPTKVFEDAYRVSETYVDRMKIELVDLNERICSATRAINSFGAITKEERWYLKKQLEAMQMYADVLYNRIRCAVEPRVAVSSESCGCNAATTKDGR